MAAVPASRPVSPPLLLQVWTDDTDHSRLMVLPQGAPARRPRGCVSRGGSVSPGIGGTEGAERCVVVNGLMNLHCRLFCACQGHSLEARGARPRPGNDGLGFCHWRPSGSPVVILRGGCTAGLLQSISSAGRSGSDAVLFDRSQSQRAWRSRRSISVNVLLRNDQAGLSQSIGTVMAGSVAGA